MSRVSQKDRMYAALAELRASDAMAEQIKPLGTIGRRRFAKRLLDQKWTTKNFTRTRFTIEPSWKGDELTTLVELSHYLLPRAVWAVRRETGESYYRREFMFTLLALVQHKFGRDAGKALRKLFVQHGVKHRPRRVMTAAQRAALAKRSPFKKTAKALDRALTTLSTAMIAVKAAKTQVAAVTGRRRINLDD